MDPLTSTYEEAKKVQPSTKDALSAQTLAVENS